MTFQTVDWWRTLFRQCPRVEVERVDTLAEGWRLWRDFELAVEQSGMGLFLSDAEALEKDAGRYLGFIRVVAHRGDTGGLTCMTQHCWQRLRAENNS